MRRGKKRTLMALAALLTVVLLAAAFGYRYVIQRPFPFLTMTYIASARDFDAAPAEFERRAGIKLGIPISREVLTQIATRAFGPATRAQAEGDLEGVRIATRAVRDIIRHGSGNRRRRLDDLFSTDPSFHLICSEAAKMLCAITQSQGQPCRVVWMQGHTVSEVFLEGRGWIMADPFGNLLFADPEGEAMSLMDLRQAYDTARPERLVTHEQFGDLDHFDYLRLGHLDDPQNVFAENDCYVVVDGRDLFSFQDLVRSPGPILRSFFTAHHSVGRAAQYVGPSMPYLGNVGVGLHRRVF